MIGRARFRGLVPLVAVVAWGCSPTLAVYVIRQPDAGVLPARETCDLHVYGDGETVPPECRELGDVFVGDTGLSTNCGSARVMGVAQESACQSGADAMQVVRVHTEGSYGSSCAQVRARFFSCPAAEVPR